jgi:hypothetical protein
LSEQNVDGRMILKCMFVELSCTLELRIKTLSGEPHKKIPLGRKIFVRKIILRHLREIQKWEISRICKTGRKSEKVVQLLVGRQGRGW